MIFINPHKCCTFVTENSCLTSNANLCIIQKLKLLPSHYLYWGETLVNRSFLAIRHILAEFFGKTRQILQQFKGFVCFNYKNCIFVLITNLDVEIWRIHYFPSGTSTWKAFEVWLWGVLCGLLSFWNYSSCSLFWSCSSSPTFLATTLRMPTRERMWEMNWYNVLFPRNLLIFNF